MKKSVFKTVEFDKIREAVTAYAGSAMGKNVALLWYRCPSRP